MRVVVSGGGTGGHVTPVLALCVALKSHSRAIIIDFVGSGSKIERQLVQEHDMAYHAVRSGKLRRYSDISEVINWRTHLANGRDAWRFVRGMSEARKLLIALKPDVVFVKGGYAGLPIGIASHRLKIPLVIHESDTVMGLTNRLLAPYARMVATGFPVDHFQDVQTRASFVYTGNPIRTEILSGTKKHALERFKLDADYPTLLVIGGSQGARAINRVVFDAITKLTTKYNIIHQTGELDIDVALKKKRALDTQKQNRYIPQTFFTKELADAYAISEIVITRCGANVLAELTALAKPSILIPLPSSANNHQLKNAQYMLGRGAGCLIEQADLTPDSLLRAVDSLVASKIDRSHQSDAMREMAVLDASDRLAKVILDTGGLR